MNLLGKSRLLLFSKSARLCNIVLCICVCMEQLIVLQVLRDEFLTDANNS